MARKKRVNRALDFHVPYERNTISERLGMGCPVTADANLAVDLMITLGPYRPLVIPLHR